MKITVCIGSSCHIKGSRQVVEELQYLIAQNNLKDKIELSGTFCMENARQASMSWWMTTATRFLRQQSKISLKIKS